MERIVLPEVNRKLDRVVEFVQVGGGGKLEHLLVEFGFERYEFVDQTVGTALRGFLDWPEFGVAVLVRLGAAHKRVGPHCTLDFDVADEHVHGQLVLGVLE